MMNIPYYIEFFLFHKVSHKIGPLIGGLFVPLGE